MLGRLGYDLVPQWYPSVIAVLGLILLVLVIASAVLLMRSSVHDYYRQADPRWEGFMRAQQERRAGGDTPPGDAEAAS